MIQPSLHPYYPALADALRVNDSRKTQAATKMRNINALTGFFAGITW
jgi:hypothetical protein